MYFQTRKTNYNSKILLSHENQYFNINFLIDKHSTFYIVVELYTIIKCKSQKLIIYLEFVTHKIHD